MDMKKPTEDRKVSLSNLEGELQTRNFFSSRYQSLTCKVNTKASIKGRHGELRDLLVLSHFVSFDLQERTVSSCVIGLSLGYRAKPPMQQGRL